MSDTPLTISVAPAEWSCIQERAAARGFQLSGHSGQIEQMGVKIAFAYDEAAQTLTFTTLNKPVFVPQSMVDSQLRGIIESSGCLAPKP